MTDERYYTWVRVKEIHEDVPDMTLAFLRGLEKMTLAISAVLPHLYTLGDELMGFEISRYEW